MPPDPSTLLEQPKPAPLPRKHRNERATPTHTRCSDHHITLQASPSIEFQTAFSPMTNSPKKSKSERVHSHNPSKHIPICSADSTTPPAIPASSSLACPNQPSTPSPTTPNKFPIRANQHPPHPFQCCCGRHITHPITVSSISPNNPVHNYCSKRCPNQTCLVDDFTPNAQPRACGAAATIKTTLSTYCNRIASPIQLVNTHLPLPYAYQGDVRCGQKSLNRSTNYGLWLLVNLISVDLEGRWPLLGLLLFSDSRLKPFLFKLPCGLRSLFRRGVDD